MLLFQVTVHLVSVLGFNMLVLMILVYNPDVDPSSSGQLDSTSVIR
jgi:hypothetical protein